MYGPLVILLQFRIVHYLINIHLVISEEPTLDKAAKVENSMHPELQKVCHKYKNK